MVEVIIQVTLIKLLFFFSFVMKGPRTTALRLLCNPNDDDRWMSSFLPSFYN
jgi:hypothetical protein